MNQPINSVGFWQKVSKGSIFLLVFFLPLFFLPFTPNVLDFNKQTLLIFLVFLSLFAWLLKSLLEEKITLNFSWFLLLPLALVAVAGLSTLFSLYPYASFWGWPLDIGQSFLALLTLAAFFFLVFQLFGGPEEIFGLVLVLALSGLVSTVFFLPQLFGKFWWPWDFAKAVSFNTLGTANSLAIFLAVLLPLASALTFVVNRKLFKALLWFLILNSLFLLLVINFQIAWLVLLTAAALILVFGISQREVFRLDWLFLPMTFLALALFALMIKGQILPLANLPLEVSPSLTASFEIVAKTLQNSKPPFSWLLGSGPGTFIYDYSLYKPVDVNQTLFWGTRFGSANSEILNWLAAGGLLGLLTFLALALVAAFFAFRAAASQEISKESSAKNFPWIIMVGLASSLAGSLIGLVFYSANLTLTFLFWFLAAVVFSQVGGKIKTFNLRATTAPWISFGASFAFIAVLILTLAIFFIQAQRYLAEVNYLAGLKALKAGNNQLAIDKLLVASRLTSSQQDNYLRDLAQIYIFQLSSELQNKSLSPEELSRRAGSLISQAVGFAKAATDVSAKNVANWTIRGFVYNNIFPIIKGADDWAIRAYEEAAKLEPSNPFIYTEMGKVYLNRADDLAKDKDKESERQAALGSAREKFQKALELKADYAGARFQLAMIDVREKRVKEAIAKLEEAKSAAPADIGLAFQLGVIYQADNQLGKAQAEFERAVGLDPNYANARYFLGLIYDKNGAKEKAINQFVKIAELNPENEEVKKILENLRTGKPALEGTAQAQPGLEEKPQEQLEKPKK
jgi:tetratricopeptide (TPR) repeat protein